MAAKVKLSIDQGTDWALRIEWKDENDDSIDLTGFTARMMLRRSFEATPAIIELTTENGRISLETAGVINLFIADADTDAIAAGSYVYDLEMVSSGGLVTRLMEGKVKIRRQVTRPDPS